VASYVSVFACISSKLMCKYVQSSSYLHRCGCWMLTGNRHCTGNNRNQECSHIDGGNMEAGCIRRCLSYQKREISSNGVMAVHCCCLVSKESVKLIALD